MYSNAIRMSLVYHPYVTRLSLVCTRMLSVCRSYVLVCHPYVTCLWFYHEPFISISQTELQRQPPEEEDESSDSNTEELYDIEK